MVPLFFREFMGRLVRPGNAGVVHQYSRATEGIGNGVQNLFDLLFLAYVTVPVTRLQTAAFKLFSRGLSLGILAVENGDSSALLCHSERCCGSDANGATGDHGHFTFKSFHEQILSLGCSSGLFPAGRKIVDWHVVVFKPVDQ